MSERTGLIRLTGNGNGNGNGNGECGGEDCPNIYRTERGTFLVQGDTSEAFNTPEGEGLVEIPEDILREATRVLGW
ncbi:hypothetical protein [Streptomyces sp. NPDC056672]|uniref:hypothetical protein n=1 Tax=Streptomyces sp. NPDC056672 TaxID=3345906 RepID=UPI00367D0617